MHCECGLQTLLEDIVNNTLVSYPVDEKHEQFKSNPKRFGVYIPSASSLFEEHVHDTDDESSWEFSAPNRSYSPSFGSQTSDSSTPAQALVARYRTGRPVLYDESQSCDTPPTTPSDSPRCFSPAVSFIDYGPESQYDRALPPADCQLSRPLSSVELLSTTYEEALQMARGLTENVGCTRPGCGDVLPDVKALMYHLHIHEIDSRLAHPSIQLLSADPEQHVKGELPFFRRPWRKFSFPLRSLFSRVTKKFTH